MQIVSSESKEIPLITLRSGEYGFIARFGVPELELAMLKIGVGCGNKVEICQSAPLGDPIAFRVNGTKIAIRKKDAALIWIFQPQPPVR
jgi:Fe2+ transport system protein FeoA